jgi:ferritin-like metal-binding protein YciE
MTTTLKDIFLSELADIYDDESRFAKALPKIIQGATDHDLKQVLANQLEETKGHVEKLEQVFLAVDEQAKGEECKANADFSAVGHQLASENNGEPINATIISVCQKIVHFEIASYDTLIERAKSLGNEEAVRLLEEILKEEEKADEKLAEVTELVEGKNQEALGNENYFNASENPESNEATVHDRFCKILN